MPPRQDMPTAQNGFLDPGRRSGDTDYLRPDPSLPPPPTGNMAATLPLPKGYQAPQDYFKDDPMHARIEAQRAGQNAIAKSGGAMLKRIDEITGGSLPAGTSTTAHKYVEAVQGSVRGEEPKPSQWDDFAQLLKQLVSEGYSKPTTPVKTSNFEAPNGTTDNVGVQTLVAAMMEDMNRGRG